MKYIAMDTEFSTAFTIGLQPGEDFTLHNRTGDHVRWNTLAKLGCQHPRWRENNQAYFAWI